ncbi:MAG: ATP-binding protein [Clostridium paraputrificum]
MDHKIDDDKIDKIFDVGFSTKENSDKNHGFGLAIVKEIVDKNKGNIEVFSNAENTQFKISLPRRL